MGAALSATLVALEHGAVAIDHVLIAVDDPERAAAVLNDRYGLTSLEGGRHPQWGTANRIVPVGEIYLELISVVDPSRASDNTFGRWVSSAGSGILRPLGWAVRAVDIDEIAGRLDLAIESGSRATPDGRQLHWKLAGVDRAAADPALPFFIEWGADTPHPSRSPVAHSAGAIEFVSLEVRGDPERLATWLGPTDLPIVIRRGRSSITRITLDTGGREIVLESIAT